jgi:hypothetical protein
MIFPKHGKVVVFDSLRMEKDAYNDFLKILEKYDYYCTLVLITTCQRFGPGGSVSQPVNLSLHAPAQMGWREMEHKGKTRLVLSRTRGVCS